MLTTLCLTSFATLAVAGSVVGNGVVKYTLTAQKEDWIGPFRRQNSVGLENQATGTAYTIDLGVGTPAQTVTVQLDTGSVDLWVNPVCAHERSAAGIAFCERFPQFNWQASSTLEDKGESWYQAYGIGNVTVEFVTDNVAVGSATIKDQQFGVATDSYSMSLGILGVGPVYTTDPNSHPQYPFFIDSLASQGLIASRAFSLDLRSIESPDGSIIFGGLDTDKYEGTLEKLPIIPGSEAPGGLERYWVTLSGISLTSDGSSASVLSTELPVLLDSGSTLSYLPQDVYTALATSFPTAQLDADSGFYIVDCSVVDRAGSVDFTFGSKTIKVAYKDIIWNPAPGTCVLGLQGYTAGGDLSFTLLGDSFLRAAYAVFDQDNQNIHLAQAANCGSNLVPITTGPDAVPSVTGGCGGTPSSSTTPPSSSTEPPASSTEPPASSTEPPASSSEPPASSTEPPASSSSVEPPLSSTTSSRGPYGNGTSPTLTSTVTKTSVYTVTSCPPTVTKCPLGHVTTEIITSLSTYCPGTETPTTTALPSPCKKCTEGSGETTSTVTIPAVPCVKCTAGEGGDHAVTTEVNPCKTCGAEASASSTRTTTGPPAVVTAGVGRLVGNAGLAVAVVVAIL